MNLSQQGADFIARHEGFVSKAYRDPVGIWTIGTGFTNRCREFTKRFGEIKPGSRITRQRNDALLAIVADAEYGAAVSRDINPRRQHEYDGAVSVCFNCGPAAAQWKWARALRDGNAAAAAARLKETAVTAKGRRLRGLVRRRQEEAALIQHGRYGVHGVPRHAARPDAPSAFDAEVRACQKKLAQLGFDPGAADGVFGPRTRSAVLAYQMRHDDLVNDGILGRATMAQIDRSIEKRLIPRRAVAGAAAILGGAMSAPGDVPSDWIFWAVFGAGLILAGLTGFLLYRFRKDL